MPLSPTQESGSKKGDDENRFGYSSVSCHPSISISGFFFPFPLESVDISAAYLQSAPMTHEI